MSRPDTGAKRNDGEDADSPPEARRAARSAKSMHEDVPVWCDCCSCEAEPYWIEAMEGSAPDGP